MSNSAKYEEPEARAGIGKGKGENRPIHAGVIQESIFSLGAAPLWG